MFALLNYLEPLQSHFDNVFSPILEDHLTVLIDCPNENRVFVPAVVTVTKILGASEQLKLHVDGRFTDHAQETSAVCEVYQGQANVRLVLCAYCRLHAVE